MDGLLDRTIPYTSIRLGDVAWALAVLVAGYVAARIAAAVLSRSLERLGVPPLVSGVIVRLVKVILYLAVALTSLSALGISTGAAAISVSAALGLILGFGLQDTLNNLAAGVWIAVTRPFKKGDFVEVAGYKGVVEDVGIMSTLLRLPGGEAALIPNRRVWGSPIVNYTRNPVRRFSFTVGVAYGTDLDLAVRTALEALKSLPLVLDDPAPQVLVKELGDSSINLEVRGWARKEDFLAARAEAIKAVYRAFAERGIEIPFPQLDVHIKNGRPEGRV